MRYFVSITGAVLKQSCSQKGWVTVSVVNKLEDRESGIQFALNELGDLPVVIDEEEVLND